MRRIHHGLGGGLARSLELPKKSGAKNDSLHPCPVCPAQLTSAHHYQRHLAAHQKSQGSFNCERCGKSFENRRKYRNHLKHHQTSSKKFECTVCGLGFLQMEFLRRHQLVHTGEKPYSCPICEVSFRQRVHLRQHQRRKHRDDRQDEPKSKACSQCDKTFLTSSELKNHMLYHQPNRAFTCQSCPMAFVERRHLDRHVRRVHSGVRHYSCRGCAKAFFEKYELNYHLKYLCRLRIQ